MFGRATIRLGIGPHSSVVNVLTKDETVTSPAGREVRIAADD